MVLTAENGNIGRKNSVISKLIPLLILNNPNLEIDVTAQNAWLEGIAPSTEDMGTMILQKVNVSNEFGAESEGALTVKKVTGTNGETVEGFTAKDIYLNAAGNLFVDGDVKAYGIADLTSQRGIITLNRTVIGGQVYISTEKTEREEGEQAGNVIINNNVTATAPGGGILIITDVGNIQTAETGTLTATNGTITASATHGDIVLRGAVTSDQKVEVDASAGSVTLDGTVESEDGEVEITAQGAVTANAAIQAGADVMLLSKNADVLVRNTVTSLAGSVNATAETGLAVIGSVHAENNIKLATDAGGITVSAQVTSDTGNISMATGGGLIEIGDTVHAIQGNVTAHVDTVRTSTDTASPIVNAIGVGGDIIAGRTVSLTAEEGSIGIGVGATTAQGKVDAGGNIIISSGKGEIDVYNSVTSTGGDISISNVEEAIYVQGAVIASAGDVKTTSVTGDILVSKDISVGENKNVLLETTKGNIYVGTFTDEEHGTVSTSGSIGATEGNTAGNVTIKTGEGVIDILKSIASTNIKVENGKGDIFIGINQPSEETVTATNNIYLSTELGQIKVYGKTSTDHGDITMKAAANNFNEENPGSNFIIGQYGQVDSGRDITLEGQNGDIHITDKIAAERNVNATIKDKGSLYFDYGLNADGAIKANVEEGNIEIGANLKVGTGGIDMQADSGNINIGHSVTATDSSIAMQTGTGNIGVGATVTSGKGDIALTTGTGNIEIGNSVTASAGNVKVTAGTGATEGTGATTTTSHILVSGDITVGANNDVLLETTKGDIYVGTFIDSGHETISANGSIGATAGNTAGNVTIKTGEGVIDILKSIASTNIDVENGDGDIIIGINESAVETVTATNNISLVTKQGQIEIYGKTLTKNGDITMKAAAVSYNEEEPERSFIIENNGQVKSGRDITLEGQNGDIHITDKITAERNVNAVINDKGSLYFDNDLSADGAITANVEEGNIEIGAAVTSGEGDVSLTTGAGKIDVGAAVTAQKDISLESGSGNINVDKEVKSELGAISVTTGNGNIHIGDNGENEETVTAAGDVTLATELGKIEVSGKTSSKNGDVTLSAKSDGYKPGADGMNIIINHNGRVEAGNSVHLNGGEGDLHISDRVSSGEDLTANVEGQGSLYFDTDIDVKGTVALATTNGDIDVGHDVTAGKSVQMKTGTGDINIGNKVTAADSVLFNTVQGDISIDNTVTAQEGNIQAHAGQGDITIGDNGPTEDTVTAHKNISLVTDDGKIYIYGKTSTKEEDIYLSVANKHFAEGEDGRLIIFDHNGLPMRLRPH